MTAQIRRVPMWIRVAGLVMAAGLAMGLALPGSAAASSSPAKPSACTGTPVRAPVATSFPSRRKKGSTDRASCPEHVPGVSGARAPGLARAKEGLRCTGIPGHGAGDRSFPVKVKEAAPPYIWQTPLPGRSGGLPSIPLRLVRPNPGTQRSGVLEI